jgi:hypothetical protein
MDLLQKYIHELENDVKLDELNLKEAALMLPAKKAKWVSRLMIEKNNLNTLYKQKNETIREAVKEIQKESAVKLTTPTLEKASERHPTVVQLNQEIKTLQIVIDFLERVEKTMQSIGFDIKNLIELIKMETT